MWGTGSVKGTGMARGRERMCIRRDVSVAAAAAAHEDPRNGAPWSGTTSRAVHFAFGAVAAAGDAPRAADADAEEPYGGPDAAGALGYLGEDSADITDDADIDYGEVHAAEQQ